MKQFIYFIQTGEGPIKIGITKNLLDRYRVLQTANYIKLKLLCAVEGTLQTESALYHKFRQYNIRGEWYEASEELLEYIRSLPTDIADSFNQATHNPCGCGNIVVHIKEEDNKFSGYCHRCLMIKDGRVEKLIERCKTPRQTKEPEQCKNCNREEIYLRHGRCSACNAYFKRKGHDRPNELLQPKLHNCVNCNRYQKQLTKKLCTRCYYHQKTYGEPRPFQNDLALDE